MQDNRPVGLTQRTAARVLGAARSEERFDRLRYNGTGPAAHWQTLPRQRVGWPVRVTGPESGGTPDLYPAVVLEFAGYFDGVPTWEDGAECWVTRLPGATGDLADESEHLGEPVGEHEDKVIFAVGTPATPASLNTQNTDGTEVDSTTTDLRFDKTTGSKVTQSGGISTHTLLAASLTQTGTVTQSFFQQQFKGTKVAQGQSPTLGFSAGPYTSFGASSPIRTDGLIGNYAGLGATGWGGVVSLTGFSDSSLPTVIGMGVAVGRSSGNYAVAWLHPDLEDVDGVHRMCWVVGDPYTVYGGLSNIPAGYAVSNAAGTHVGIDRNFASGELPVVRGGIVVGWTSPSSPPAPAIPPPATIPPTTPSPPPPPPEVLPTTTLSGTVLRAISEGGAAVAGRTVTLLGIGTTTTTDASGNYSFAGVFGGGTRFVQVSLLPGESATHVIDGGGTELGNVAIVILSASTHDVDFRLDNTSTDAMIVVTVRDATTAAPLAGRTVTVAGVSQTTNTLGQTTFTGVAPGTTSVVLTIGGSETAAWSVDTPAASGDGATATFTAVAGDVHGVEFDVSGVVSGGGG